MIDPVIVASVLLGALSAWLGAWLWCRTAVRGLAAEAVRLRRLLSSIETALEHTGTVEVRRDPEGGLVIVLAAPPVLVDGQAPTD